MSEQLTDWQLMRLRDCARSNRIGMKDRGFPGVMKELAALGLVYIYPDGAVVTLDAAKLLAAPQTKTQLMTLGGS